MASEPPRTPPNDDGPTEGGEVPKGAVSAFVAHDSLIPASQVAPLVEAQVGRMKAEVRSEFEDRLSKIDHLPSLTQMVITNIVTIVGAVGLFFAVASYFGDRQDTAIDRSSSISGSLSRIEEKIDGNDERIRELEADAEFDAIGSERAGQNR
ncbi:hypothetical protein [Qipengyuania sp. 902]|uniref:hypothetical protein n=1 Tax=Qipengyuania sp. 902 TaxID=3417565 RepID=UPI003EBC0AC5